MFPRVNLGEVIGIEGITFIPIEYLSEGIEYFSTGIIPTYDEPENTIEERLVKVPLESIIGQNRVKR